MNASDAIGWFGFVLVLFSYAMVAMRQWRVRSIPNQLGNIIGPGSLGINSFFYKAWVPVALNVIWVSIAIYILLQIIRQKEQG